MQKKQTIKARAGTFLTFPTLFGQKEKTEFSEVFRTKGKRVKQTISDVLRTKGKTGKIGVTKRYTSSTKKGGVFLSAYKKGQIGFFAAYKKGRIGFLAAYKKSPVFKILLYLW